MSRTEEASGSDSRSGMGASPPQGASHARTPSRSAWIAGWSCILAIALWISQLSGLVLLLAAACALAWSIAAIDRPRDLWRIATAAALWLTIGLGAGVQKRLNLVATEWAALEAQIETEGATSLNEALDRLVDDAERAVTGAAGIAATADAPTRGMFTRLEDLRDATGVSAIALLDEAQSPYLWAGEHRGSLPPGLVVSGRYLFHQGPLFSYLYFTTPLPSGGVAVAAVLLESELPATGREPFASSFARRTGLTPRFTGPADATGTSIWDWSTGDGEILSVSFEELTQSNWWTRVTSRARWGVGAGLFFALSLLTLGWYHRRTPFPGLPVAVITAVLLLAPVGEMIGAEALYSPVQFVLPLPIDVTLGMLLVLLGGVAVWALIRTIEFTPPRITLPWWGQGLAGTTVVVAVMEGIRGSAAVGLRAGSPGGGVALQLATALSIAVPAYLLLWAGQREPRGGASRLGLILGFLLVIGCGIVLVTVWNPVVPVPVWGWALFGIPFAFLAAGLPSRPTRHPSLRAWIVAGAFGIAVALPCLWLFHVQAKLRSAEIELARLGTESDPFLDFLLRTFAERARSYADDGEEGVDLLYHSWVASGLAREGYEARLTIWEGGEIGQELRLSGFPEMPAAIPEAVSAVRGTDMEVVARYTEVEGLHYLLLVPLQGDQVISVGVPPRSRLSRATPLARFLQPDAERDASDVVESLYLVGMGDSLSAEASVDHGPAPAGREVMWLRTETGWRSEARAPFPSGWMHVHLFVRTAPLVLLLVRAVLVTTALLAGLGLLWVCARVICGGLPPFPYVQGRWLKSFRGRLTLALFVFFLLPTAVFAVAAYQAVSREVIRSAAGVSLRALEQTVGNISSVPLSRLGSEVGMDLLLYRGGALVDAAAPEVLELGLFDSWLPPAIYATFATGEDLEDWEIRTLGANEYVVGYRRFDADAVFAAPTPLASDEIRRRQTEFRDAALFMMLFGGGLSVVLSLLVGRAFTRPIDELSRAAAAIGGGNFRLQLHAERQDEFGPVYQSFNRMARRLRRARSALERETRRTETIVAEAATGVLALDSGGRIELANPRAGQILDAVLERGEQLPRGDPLPAAVAAAVDEFLASALEEDGREIEVEGRTVRLRLRLLSPAGGRRGAVVALEDVTSEIRTTRVLAWGEMARQVAHEIKNPLTPIKLAVQHLRRAYLDGRADFGAILDRNVESILLEIDRLSEIARAFSRFGTPAATTAELETIDVVRAVTDALALYRGTGDGVRYHFDAPSPNGVHAIGRLGELKEVLVNLLENAREALDGDGQIRVSIERSDPRWVEIVVADDGEGIPPELLARVFEPQFSTRTSGTGLGLAIVRRMVESWGGEAEAESEPGVGTRIHVRLRAEEA